MTSGLPWSEAFIAQLSDKEFRDAFVADQVRTRIAQLVRVLREHPDRNWTQTELGERADKRQNVISRLENPDEAQPSVQTLLDICGAFDLPLWIDFPTWEDWLVSIKEFPSSKSSRPAFEANRLNSYNSRSISSSSGAGSVMVNVSATFSASPVSINDNYAPTALAA